MAAAWYTIAAHAVPLDGEASADARDAFQPVGISVLTTEVGGHGHVQVTSTVTHSCLVDYNTSAGGQLVRVQHPGTGMEFLRESIPTDMREIAAELTQLRLVVQDELVRALPAWAGDFPQLTTLRLSGGPGIAELPPALTRLARLRTVQLERMQGLSVLPAWVARWTALATLEIAECGVQALPDALAALTGLRELTLKHLPALERVPLLTSLHALAVHHCGIAELPAEMGAMTQLGRLVVSACARLRGLQASAGALAGLHSLCVLACPRIRAIPPECRALCARLRVLQVSNMRPAPDWLGECSQLQELCLCI